MFADEIAYRAVMNNFGIDALINADEMMRNSVGIAASEYVQMIGIADLTANNPTQESIKSELEKMQATQTSLEIAMNSPALEAIRYNDRIFAGVNGGLLDIGPKISGSEEMNGRVSLSDCAGFAIKSLAEESIAASFINGLGNGLIGSSFGDGIKGTCLGSTIEECSKNWMDMIPKTEEIKPIPEPRLILPERTSFILPDIPYLPSNPMKMSLSDDTIEKLAEELAKRGNKVIVIAKNKSVAIVGNASHDIINTGDHV
jgi:hypothetical protein